jgi:hypothetical protein
MSKFTHGDIEENDLNSTELRIGNCVRVNSPGNSAHGHTGRIIEVGQDYVHLHFVNFCELSSLEPIILNSEIFEKIGLELIKDEQNRELWYNEDCTWCVTDISDDQFSLIHHETHFVSIPFKYLHQLQNLYFTLFSRELSVEL